MKCLITCIKQQLTLSSDVHQQHWTSTLIVSPRIFRQISHHQQRPHLNERVNSPLCTMSMGTGFHPVTRDNTLVIYQQCRRSCYSHIYTRNNAGLLDKTNSAKMALGMNAGTILQQLRHHFDTCGFFLLWRRNRQNVIIITLSPSKQTGKHKILK